MSGSPLDLFHLVNHEASGGEGGPSPQRGNKQSPHCVDGNWHICFILKTDTETFYFFLVYHTSDPVNGTFTHWNMEHFLVVQFDFFKLFFRNISARVFVQLIETVITTPKTSKRSRHTL